MNELLIKLKHKDVLTHKEMFNYQKLFMELTVSFVDKLAPGSGESDSPSEITVVASSKSLLETALSTYQQNVAAYEKSIDIPRKIIETEEMKEMNQFRLLDFGTIKKIVYNIFTTDKKNTDAILIWYLIRINKNMAKLKIAAISTSMRKFVAEMESETYKSACTNLNLNEIIASLKEKNTKVDQLLLKKSYYIKENYKSVKPYRKICTDEYLKIFRMLGSVLDVNYLTDYSTFITQMNGYTEYYNNITSIKLMRRKNKKEEENKKVDPPAPQTDDKSTETR